MGTWCWSYVCGAEPVVVQLYCLILFPDLWLLQSGHHLLIYRVYPEVVQMPDLLENMSTVPQQVEKLSSLLTSETMFGVFCPSFPCLLMLNWDAIFSPIFAVHMWFLLSTVVGWNAQLFDFRLIPSSLGTVLVAEMEVSFYFGSLLLLVTTSNHISPAAGRACGYNHMIKGCSAYSREWWPYWCTRWAHSSCCKMEKHRYCSATKPDTLDSIQTEKSGDLAACLESMVTDWLEKNYNWGKFGPPSWQMLDKAVSHPAGGAYMALAEKIAETHKAGGMSSRYIRYTTVDRDLYILTFSGGCGFKVGNYLCCHGNTNFIWQFL